MSSLFLVSSLLSVKGLKVVGQLWRWCGGGWASSALPFCPEFQGSGVGGDRLCDVTGLCSPAVVPPLAYPQSLSPLPPAALSAARPFVASSCERWHF